MKATTRRFGDTVPMADDMLTTATYAQRIAFVCEIAGRLHSYGTTAQRLEGTVVGLSQRLGLDCEPWSNPTGLILSFSDPARPLGASDSTRVIRLAPGETDLHKLSEADRIADAFTELRRTEYRLYPDAHATVDALRDAGVRLALVTNGAAETQRAKIERFDLAHRFHHIQIEGEFGQGKPELAVYRHALERLDVAPGEAWMVGDNYEWEVVAPQMLGMCGIWYDPFGAGVPAHATAQPPVYVLELFAKLREAEAISRSEIFSSG